MSSLNEKDSDVEKVVDSSNIASHEDEFLDAHSAENKALVKRFDTKILPLCAFIYLLCYLDRSNIGNAKIMNSETKNSLMDEAHLTNGQYTVALMIFLVAYGLFEVPSNYLLKKLTPSRWISFIMFSWGAITIGLGGVKNAASVTVVRFLLGVVEAGLFPGLVYYLTFWYRSDERGFRVAIIFASATLAGAFGGVVAYGISHMNRVGGLSGFRWLFILEGAPSCLCSILVWFILPNYPATSTWLSEEEKDLARRRLLYNGGKHDAPALTWKEAKGTLLDWRLYLHYSAYFGVSLPFSSLSLFSPSIVAGLGYTSIDAQLMTVPPFAVAYIITLAVSYSADKTNSRALHSMALATIGAAGFIASANLPGDAYLHRYGCLIVAASGSFACIPSLLGWLSSNLRTTGATGFAIALNVGLGGATGQIAGVFIYKANEKAKGYPTGHWVNGAMLLMTALSCAILMVVYRRRNQLIKSGVSAPQPLWVF
ncbi:MFS transporter [Flagelloscypha sp. PMI_526]|nr:MFS transporter [Flagelloscypha sp. PMI_526]